jgi:hypothetical protein
MCYNKHIHSKEQLVKYKVQINMAEFYEPDLWQDVYGAKFGTQEQAHAHIEWMKKEYGDQIEYCVILDRAHD